MFVDGKSRTVFFPSDTLIYGISRGGLKNYNIRTCEHMILGQLWMGARQTNCAPLGIVPVGKNVSNYWIYKSQTQCAGIFTDVHFLVSILEGVGTYVRWGQNIYQRRLSRNPLSTAALHCACNLHWNWTALHCNDKLQCLCIMFGLKQECLLYYHCRTISDGGW